MRHSQARRDPSAARNLVLETRAVIHARQVDIGLRSLTKPGQLDQKKVRLVDLGPSRVERIGC